MIFLFECKKCNYSTKNKSHFDKHLATKKHKNMFKCLNCNLQLCSKSSYYRHKKECNISLIEKIENINNKIISIENRLSDCEEYIKKIL